MIDWIDWVLMVLYCIAVGCASYIILAHRKYFQERIRKGIVSAFMLAMLFFLAAYDLKLVVAVWIRSSEIFGYRTPDIEYAQRFTWLIVHVGTATGLAILALLTYKRRFDLYVVLRKRDRKEEDKK